MRRAASDHHCKNKSLYDDVIDLAKIVVEYNFGNQPPHSTSIIVLSYKKPQSGVKIYVLMHNTV